MSRRRYRHSGGDSLESVVDDSAYIAARFGPVGALTTGVVGFTVFYSLLPIALMAWVDVNKAKLVGPAATVFANILDQVMLQRFINPCQWAGTAILLACCAIAAWKALFSDELTSAELAGTSWLAKLLSRLLR
ncbi:hypothetical protein VL04_18360 [Chromobacterium violaceum]|uniref:hypothetical protein n=1 Tax=Chromobacterium violaceum TaxID=536 RepID=UPI000653BA66|nr:hypothetical protein [Chromobacterium violaceum]KMN48636.1 hypothetical protein VK93_14030 [Chromobacterium violaceum]KMN87731.1 hypothetical protein VL02_00025 [Chromobacterium violaceum]KMN88840.1 hypothetical protein VL04_18360 [Chromobacterium violaceum]KMO05334.1 hypothetical protein VL16_02010 [Chromobacterium violaceum]